MSGAYLAVDAGGTQTRAAVRTASGRVGTGAAGPANWTTLGAQPCVTAIQSAADQALREAGLRGSQVDGGCIAMAGYYPPWHTDEAHAALAGLIPARHLLLVPDLIAAWAGATGGAAGVVLVAGTGAVAYGRDQCGNEARAGGWGPLIGDEGGGYWIGLEVLRAVARALDGRGGPTSLTEAICHRSEPAVESGRRQDGRASRLAAEETLRAVYRDNWSREYIAALSVTAAEHAANGDAVAVDILQRAAAELGRLIAAVADRLEWTDASLPICLTGGLSSAGPPLWNPLKLWMSLTHFKATWRHPLADPLEGALWLARQEAQE